MRTKHLKTIAVNTSAFTLPTLTKIIYFLNKLTLRFDVFSVFLYYFLNVFTPVSRISERRITGLRVDGTESWYFKMNFGPSL